MSRRFYFVSPSYWRGRGFETGSAHVSILLSTRLLDVFSHYAAICEYLCNIVGSKALVFETSLLVLHLLAGEVHAHTLRGQVISMTSITHSSFIDDKHSNLPANDREAVSATASHYSK